MHTFTTCLCFKDQAEEAARFYASVFSELKITGLTRCGANEFDGPVGSVRTVSFELFDRAWLAVNGGPHFSFNDGVSLIVNCDTQDEIDRLWTALTRRRRRSCAMRLAQGQIRSAVADRAAHSGRHDE